MKTTIYLPLPYGCEMTLMACRGLTQCVLQLPIFGAPKAARKICISPRSFQDLARSSSRNLLSSSSQTFDNLIRCAQSRALHTSERACKDGAVDDYSIDKSQVADANSGQGAKSFGSIRSEQPYLGQLKSSALRESVKMLMRSVPQPVAIVTATNTEVAEGGPEGWRGATISSFNTVTLDPEPIVSFNIKKISSTFDAIQASGRFWLHFLTPEPSSARLADRFTKRHSEELFKGVLVSYGGDRNISFPQIRGLRGSHSRDEGQQIAFVLVCRFLEEKTVTIGDHVVLFATIIGINSQSLANKNAATEGAPCLVYADRGYHGLKHLEIPRKELTMRLRASSKE